MRAVRPAHLRIAFAVLVLGLSGAIAGSVVAAHTGNGPQRQVAFRDLAPAIGRLSEFGRPTQHTFRHERNYIRYVSERLGTAVPVPYPEQMVVLFAVGPRSTPAYRVRVQEVVQDARGIRVRIRETAPGPGDTTPSRLTFPYIAISIPFSRKPVTIDWLGRP